MQHAPRVEGAVLAPRNIHLISPPPDPKVWEAEIIVGVSLHNQSQTLNRCLSSIFAQTGLSSPLAIMVLDDIVAKEPGISGRYGGNFPKFAEQRRSLGEE